MIDFLTPVEWSAFRLSLIVALYSVAFSLPLAIAMAWLLARGKFWGKGVLDATELAAEEEEKVAMAKNGEPEC